MPAHQTIDTRASRQRLRQNTVRLAVFVFPSLAPLGGDRVVGLVARHNAIRWDER